MGAMRTTAADSLVVHADILPIELLFHNMCNHATLHLATLPMTHLLHKPVKSCTRHLVKHHPSPLHILLHTFVTKPSVIETITPAAQCPNKPNTFTAEMATSCNKSKKDDRMDQSDI